MIKAILYPGAKLFVTAGGKEQGSGILKEKINELCDLGERQTGLVEQRKKEKIIANIILKMAA